MKQSLLCFVVVAMSLANPAFAAEPGSITIISPKEGAVLQGGGGSRLEYNLHLSPNGNHLHIYIDDQDPIIGRNVSNCPCSIGLPALAQIGRSAALSTVTESIGHLWIVTSNRH